jgi:cytochrome c
MMHKLLSIVIAMALLTFFGAPNGSSAGSGEALFTSLKCGACHKPDQKATAVPLTELAKAYQDQARLVNFFKGESPMIVESTKSGMMKGQLKYLETLSDDDKKALADYILSFK